MTRTARALSPRAMVKDRHENKSGMSGNMRKGGSGPHNWGSLDDERELEEGALEDDEFDEGRDKLSDDASGMSGYVPADACMS